MAEGGDRSAMLRTCAVAVGGAVLGAATVLALHWRLRAENARLRQHGLSTADTLRNMQETDVFVLDNSLRETTVASLYGHTIDGKYRILEAVRAAGMKHLIIGAFGPTRRVDENFIQSLKDRGELRADEHYYAFSEFKDSDAPWFEGARSAATAAEEGVPYGLSVCKQLGIPNVVFEIDLLALWDEPGGVESILAAMVARKEWCRRELSPDSRVLFNLRDFQLAWPRYPARVLYVVERLARLSPDLRPFGLMYEDQNGSWLPKVMADATLAVRRCMSRHGWADAHWLVHVHKGYGLSDATQLAAIGAGASGVWCGVSANGAMTGHASSLLTLTNLARLGNRHVLGRYNFLALRNAAITVHQVCTKEDCPPYLTEIYGQGALDLVWGGGLMANQWAGDQAWSRTTDCPFELQKLLGIQPRVRITTMAGPAMYLTKLTDLFGPVVEAAAPPPNTTKVKERWPRLEPDAGGAGGGGVKHVGHEMHALIHADLRNLQRRNYNHHLGLLDLYRRAYDLCRLDGRIGAAEHARTKGFLAKMQVIANAAAADLDDHPLIKELLVRFCPGGTGPTPLGEGADEGKTTRWDFQLFYPLFLEPYTHDMAVAERLFGVLDTDGSGEVSASELLSACKWVLCEFEGNQGGSAVHLDSLDALMQTVVREWLVPEMIISEMCAPPPSSAVGGVLRSQPEPEEQAGSGEVRVLTGATVRDAVLRSGKNVLTMFYDPSCPHCVALMPEIEKVAAATAGDASVVVAKLDVAANSVPAPFEVTAVPTLYFKSASGFPFRHRGLRKARDLLDLIESNRA